MVSLFTGDEKKPALSKMNSHATDDDYRSRREAARRIADLDRKLERSIGIRDYWSVLEYHKLTFIYGLLGLSLVLCFMASLAYVVLNEDTRYTRGSNFVVERTVVSSARRADLEEASGDRAPVGTEDRSSIEIYRNAYSIVPEDAKERARRSLEPGTCVERSKHCDELLRSMQSIAAIVNGSMPHIEALTRNLSRAGGAEDSKILDVIRCIECKRMQPDGPGSVRVQSNSTRTANVTANVRTVMKLLNGSPDSIEDSSSTDAEDGEAWKKKTNSTVDERKKPPAETDATPASTPPGSTRDPPKTANETTTTRVEGTIHGAEVTTPRPSGGSTGAIVPAVFADRPKAGSVNVTAAIEGRDVPRIPEADAEHPSVHPSSDGRPEEHAGVTAEQHENSNAMFAERARYQDSKLSPTAESIKTSQQLQLTPTMSWMPYPVCFYGTPMSGGFKQPAPGQVVYPGSFPSSFPGSFPGSSPGIHPGASSAFSHAFTGPQQRGPPFAAQPSQLPATGVPNYVQVQAQSVQFMPGGSPTNAQRVGPTGPGYQSGPMFPGYQPSAGGANPGARSPYYCTYVPAPTFQFPPITDVTDFQRNVDARGNHRGANLTQPGNAWHAYAPAYAISDRRALCPTDSYQCASGDQCVAKVQWCNGYADCPDASDETRCLCSDRIAKERLCDGYFDCPHGEDELGCFGCPQEAFNCGDWSRRYTADNCVPLSSRCDGVKQCPNGRDEVDCNILTDSYIERNNVLMIGYTSGYLHKNYKGQWYPACSATMSWAMDACISEIGKDMLGVPRIEIHAIPESQVIGPYLAQLDNGLSIVPSCVNTTVYVRCPPIPCGTSVLSYRDYHPYRVAEEPATRPVVIGDEERMIGQAHRGAGALLGNSDSDLAKDSVVGMDLRVVGGRASKPKAWPFLVAIYKNGDFHCGGVIVNEHWILTAAHCILRYSDYYFEVQAGMLRRLSFSPMAQTRKARYAIIHPSYEGRNMVNDIAMMMLDEPLRFNRWIRPACLPEVGTAGNAWRRGPPVGSNCVAIGWGAIGERGPDPDHLREVEVPILPSCKHEGDQSESVICAGYQEGGYDTCQGDSGGPLMCRNPNAEDQTYVAGIVSHGEGCARPHEPGVYTKVSYFSEWIQNVSNGRELPPIGKVPLDRCPGFSCEGGLGKCLSIQRRCDRKVDCLDGEDEVNCFWNKPLHNERYSDAELVGAPLDRTEVETNSTGSPELGTVGTDAESSTTPTSRTTFDADASNANETLGSRSFAEIEKQPTVTSTFTCKKLLQTIPIGKRCDRSVDCEDGTDEDNCTCRDRLNNLRASSICDGRVDCADGTDEENCEICTGDEFFCHRSGRCVALSKRCDGANDCPLMEDELDCLCLSNGEHVHTDAEGRPELRTEGVLTRHKRGEWYPACHRSYVYKNQSSAVIIGRNMCIYFGFAGLLSVKEVSVKDSAVETRPTYGGTSPRSRFSPMFVAPSHGDRTCSGLYVRCRPVPSGRPEAHLIVDPKTGGDTYQWPWIAAIFVDGQYRCSAILLEPDWLLCSSKCTEGLRLSKNYTTALLGASASYLLVDGPYQQVSIVDDARSVKQSEAVLLRLRTPTNFTRHVQPLFVEKKIYPAEDSDTCVAVGTDASHRTRSVLLQPVLQNTPKCHRCFVDNSTSPCAEDELETDWSGTVFCLGPKGWYPAAVFHERNGPCSFRNVTTLTSIDYINAYLTQAMDDEPHSTTEPSCDGFRCNLGECIPRYRVCNGVEDCRDGADENPESCIETREHCRNEVAGCNCTKSEMRCESGQCVAKGAFCDERVDCEDGTDEPAQCTCARYLRLSAPWRLCDGVRHCVDKTDESPELCACREGSFECGGVGENRTCVPQDFVCDGEVDCPNGEDEAECRKIRPFSSGSPNTGEVIRRSYGVWHTDCYGEPVTSREDVSRACRDLGYVSGGSLTPVPATFDAGEPVVATIDEFYLVKLNAKTWMALRDDEPLVRLVKPAGACRRLFVTCA